jgi:hypothetical protein
MNSGDGGGIFQHCEADTPFVGEHAIILVHALAAGRRMTAAAEELASFVHI